MAKKPTKNRLFAEVVETAVRFHGRRLWTQLNSTDPISVMVEGEEHPTLCFVVGPESPHVGLYALRGEHALEAFETMVLIDSNFGDNASCDLLMVNFKTYSESNPVFLNPAHLSGRVFGKNSTAPLFLSQPVHEKARGMTRPELRIMPTLMDTLLGASSDQLQQLPWGQERQTLELTLEGKGKKAVIRDSVRTWPGVSPPLAEGGREVAPPIDAWTTADSLVTQRLHDATFGKGDARKPVPLKLYFRDMAIARAALGDPEDATAEISYLNWFCFDYRPRDGAPTVAERILNESRLPQAERVLLQARADARATFSRIIKVEPGVWMDMENVVSGEVTRVHDVHCSRPTGVGLCQIVRLYRVEEWTFMMLVGPVVSATVVPKTLRGIEALGHRFEDGYLTGDGTGLGGLFETHTHPSTPVQDQ